VVSVVFMRLQSFVEDDGQERRLVWGMDRVVRDGGVVDGRQTSAEPGQRTSTVAGAWSSPAPWLADAGGLDGEAPRREFGQHRSRGYCRGRRPEPAGAMAGESPAS
jgi:hypothetical protein